MFRDTEILVGLRNERFQRHVDVHGIQNAVIGTGISTGFRMLDVKETLHHWILPSSCANNHVGSQSRRDTLIRSDLGSLMIAIAIIITQLTRNWICSYNSCVFVSLLWLFSINYKHDYNHSILKGTNTLGYRTFCSYDCFWCVYSYHLCP